jgi:hypothetical protein
MIQKEFIQHPNNKKVLKNKIPYFCNEYSDREFNVFEVKNEKDNKTKYIVIPSGLDLSILNNLELIFKTDIKLFKINVLPFTETDFRIEQKKGYLKRCFKFVDNQTYKVIPTLM